VADGTLNWTRLRQVVKWVAIGIAALLSLYLIYVAIVFAGAALGLWPLSISTQ
jgi:hypothetical protein